MCSTIAGVCALYCGGYTDVFVATLPEDCDALKLYVDHGENAPQWSQIPFPIHQVLVSLCSQYNPKYVYIYINYTTDPNYIPVVFVMTAILYFL